MTEPNSVKAVLEQLAEAERQRAEPNLSSKQRRARTVSRLAAVQALYQMELAGEPASATRPDHRDGAPQQSNQSPVSGSIPRSRS